MDPLTAVVFLAIASAGAAVAMLQMDQDAVASVELPLDTFTAGDLPPVCCKTGERSEAAVIVGQRKWFRTIVEGTVPVTKARLAEFSGWQELHRRAFMAFVPIVVIGLFIRFAANSLFVSWAVDLSILAVLFLVVYARLMARRLLVRPRRTLDGKVVVRGVHPRFVDAVRASRSSA